MAYTPYTVKYSGDWIYWINDHAGFVICTLKNKQHAEHIVHCVNNHDALVKSLEEIIKYADGNCDKRESDVIAHIANEALAAKKES
ncbi:hypothetical protein KAR91_60020 [Candidatus Pacearchaeota archaeon]|nr:hypothetical protein [Candidatus Pacearchaeota archaeon]